MSVPPGAWRGNATVTVNQPNPTRPVVELSITPASKNNFVKPVTLVVDISRVSAANLPGLSLSGLNTKTGLWLPTAGASVDLEARTMSIPLWHFSKYRVEVGGRLGW